MQDARAERQTKLRIGARANLLTLIRCARLYGAIGAAARAIKAARAKLISDSFMKTHLSRARVWAHFCGLSGGVAPGAPGKTMSQPGANR